MPPHLLLNFITSDSSKVVANSFHIIMVSTLSLYTNVYQTYDQ
jgi:hypothetical protein